MKKNVSVIMKNFCKFDAEGREFAESLNKLFKQHYEKKFTKLASFGIN